jgi:uncharacterized protein
MRTAATEYIAGVDGTSESTPHEGNTENTCNLQNHWMLRGESSTLSPSAGGAPMKRFVRCAFAAAFLCLLLAPGGLAQTDADAPASKEDVERYLNAIHSRDMMKQTMAAMAAPMHQMVHEQFVKDKDRLPADFEARLNKIMDDMINDMPTDELLDAMVPAFQKHLTKGDIDALVAFYSAPTGQKMLREMPSMMAEYMQSVQPIMRRSIDKMQDRLQDQIAQMKKDSAAKPTAPAQN